MSEMIVIAVIALIFIGPDQIPEVARTVGRFLNELRRSTDDLKTSFHHQTGLPKTLDDVNVMRRKAHVDQPVESEEVPKAAVVTHVVEETASDKKPVAVTEVTDPKGEST